MRVSNSTPGSNPKIYQGFTPGPSAWLGRELAKSTRWIRTLTPVHIAEIDAALETVEREGLEWREVTKDNFPLPGMADFLEEIRQELEEGSGLMKLKGLPVARYTHDQLRKLYFGLGNAVGTPVFQNRRGELMRLIRDEGGNVGAR